MVPVAVSRGIFHFQIVVMVYSIWMTSQQMMNAMHARQSCLKHYKEEKKRC